MRALLSTIGSRGDVQLVVALADPSQIVGLSPYASDPNISVIAGTARTFPRLALQAEAMVPLKPDLVLVGTWDRPLTQRLLRLPDASPRRS